MKAGYYWVRWIGFRWIGFHRGGSPWKPMELRRNADKGYEFQLLAFGDGESYFYSQERDMLCDWKFGKEITR